MRIFILVFAILLPVFGHAQAQLSKNFKVEIGTAYPVVNAGYRFQFFKDGQILMIKFAKDFVQISKFDANTMRQVASKEYTDLPSGLIFEDVKEVNDKYYFFYSSWDKENKIERLYSREIGFENGEFVAKAKKIVAVVGKCTSVKFRGLALPNQDAYVIAQTPKFNIHVSGNSSNFMVQYRQKPESTKDSKNYDNIGTHIFDQNQNIIFSKTYRMPYTEEQMDNLDYELDFKGNVYLLARVKKENEKGKITDEGAHLELIMLPKEENSEYRITVIELSDKFIADAWLFENVFGEIMLGGFYNSKKSGLEDSKDLRQESKKMKKAGMKMKADGLFFSQIEPDGKIVKREFFDIPIDIINQNVKLSKQQKNQNKESKGKDVGLINYKIKEIIRDENNSSFLVISECEYIENITKSNNYSQSQYSYSYHFEDILLTKISESGDLLWMRKLPKKQEGRKGKGSMGYKYMQSGNQHYIVYVDNVRNLDLNDAEVAITYHDGGAGYLTAYRVEDESGNVNKDAIFDIKDVKGVECYQLSMERLFLLNNSEFAVEVYKKKKEDILIKVSALD